MTYDPQIHHRRSIRLKNYDYGASGAYFITVCTQNRDCLFGDVVDGQMSLYGAGLMVEHWWMELSHKFQNVEIDQFIVMPNHFHGIVVLGNATVAVTSRGDDQLVPLPAVVQWFKTMTTNAYIHGVKSSKWREFDGRLWQRNYYEHIIRSEASLEKVREYIAMNPYRWNDDPENPSKP